MSVRFPVSGVRVAGALLLAACATAPAATGPVADPSALYEQAKKAHQEPRMLTADAKAFVEAPQNSGRYELHVSVKRPDSLRIEALTPVGDPAAVLVASGGKFALMDLRNNTFYRGPATAANLARLLPVSVPPEELVAVVTGAIPDRPGSQATDSKREGQGSLLTLSSRGAVDEVSLGGDLRVTRIRRLAGDKPEWTVDLDQHQDARVPMLLRFDAPAAKTKVDLRMRNVQTGKEPPESAFRLQVPQGARVEEVQ